MLRLKLAQLFLTITHSPVFFFVWSELCWQGHFFIAFLSHQGLIRTFQSCGQRSLLHNHLKMSPATKHFIAQKFVNYICNKNKKDGTKRAAHKVQVIGLAEHIGNDHAERQLDTFYLWMKC